MRKPKLSKIELIAMSLTSEYMSFNIEYHLVSVCLKNKQKIFI